MLVEKIMCLWCGAFIESAFSDYCHIDAIMNDIVLVRMEDKKHYFISGKLSTNLFSTQYTDNDIFDEYR